MATVKLDPAKGVQIPNKTTTERNAISSPETGALVWNTTTSAVNQYNGSAWGTVGISEDTTKLPLAGGALTGAVTTNSTFDGVDIATRDAILTSTTTTAGAALPKAGGAMTGTITNFRSTGIDDNADALAMTITSAERVGINKTAPDARLEIVSASETALVCETTVSGEYAFIAKSSSTNATPIADFRSGSTSHLKVLANGRVLSQANVGFWVRFETSGTPSIQDSYNVTSIGDWGTGDYGIYITSGFSNANYCVHGTCQNDRYISVNTSNTQPQGGRVDIEIRNNSNALEDMDIVYVSAIGDM